MSLDVDVAGRDVLITDCTPATIATVTSLLGARAKVTVSAVEITTSVRDLAERGLITHDPAAVAADFDMVLKTQAVAPPAPPSGRGEVVLVGGGIGDPGLITVAGLQELRTAEVVVHDRLAPLALLEGLSAELIDVGKIPRGEFTPQERINQVLIEQAGAGRKVVRLKGGDSFVFGRGGEEWLACAEAGISVRSVPGISSSIAAAELAGVPVTHRGLSQGFTVVSGHVAPGDPRGDLDWAALARTGTTLVILMGVGTLPKICSTLIEEGLSPDTPAITVADAGLPSMRHVRAPLAEIADTVEREGLGAPAVTVIGAVAGLRLD